MELTKEQESIYLDLTSLGWEFIINDGVDIIVAKPIITNDSPVRYESYVRIDSHGGRWDIAGGYSW